MKSVTGPIPIIGESDPGSLGVKSSSEPIEVLSENVEPTVRVIWAGRDAVPSKLHRDRMRGMLAITVAITASSILVLTTVGIVFFGLSAANFVMINGVSAAYLALSRVTSWYFSTRNGRKAR